MRVPRALPGFVPLRNAWFGGWFGTGLRGAIAAFLIYLFASVVLFGLPVLSHLSRDCLCIPTTTDESASSWALAWWPHALLHGLNPFFPRIIYAPQGIDIAQGALMPGLALALTPVTALTSPLVAYNLAALMAPPLAAFTAFLLCRRLTGQFWPSLVGGWLFGFSTYMLGQDAGHLNLSLVFLVPVLVYVSLRAYAGEATRRRSVIELTIALVGQFSLSVEIFATFTLFAAIALVIAWALGDSGIRAALRGLVGVAVGAYVATLVIVSPYLWYALKPGGEPVLPWRTTEFSADLLSFVVPNQLTRVLGIHFLHTTEKFTAGYIEGAAYLGLPLLLLAALGLWFGRRRVETKLLAWMLAIVLVCSLGAHLHVDGHELIPLPWDLVSHLPFLGVVIPSRFVMYATLIVAVLASTALARRSHPRAADPVRRSIPWERTGRWVLAAVAIVSLWPDLRYSFWNSRPQLPALFTTSAYRRVLRPDDIVLALPVGIYGSGMLWQAEAHLGFTMAGGYVVPPEAPDPDNSAAIYPTLAYDAIVPHVEQAAAEFIAAHHITVAVMSISFAKLSPWPAILDRLGWRGTIDDGAVLFRPHQPHPT
jgi:hypothetical protein